MKQFLRSVINRTMRALDIYMVVQMALFVLAILFFAGYAISLGFRHYQIK